MKRALRLTALLLAVWPAVAGSADLDECHGMFGRSLQAWAAGRHAETVGSLSGLLGECAGNGYGLAALSLLASLRGATADYLDRVLPAIEGALAAGPATPFHFRALIEMDGLLRRASGDEPGWQAADRRLGLLPAFDVWGPVGGYPNLEFDTAAPPTGACDGQPVIDDPVRGRIEPVTFDRRLHDPSRLPPGRGIHHRAYRFSSGGGPHHLLVDAGLSWRAELDGRPLHWIDRRIGPGPRAVVLGVDLAPGRHCLLLTLAAGHGQAAAPTVALLDGTGRGSDASNETAGPGIAGWSGTARVGRLHGGLAAGMAGAIAGAVIDLLVGDAVAARERFVGIEPDDRLASAAAVAEAVVVLRSGHLDRRPVREEAGRLLEQALDRDPGALQAAYHLSFLDEERDQADRAVVRIRHCAGERPDSLAFQLRLFELYRKAGWEQEAAALVGELPDLRRCGRPVWLRRIESFLRGLGEQAAARRVAETLAATDLDGWQPLVRHLARGLAFDPALELTVRAAGRQPFEREAAAGRIDLLIKAGRMGEAAAALDDLAGRVGRDGLFEMRRRLAGLTDGTPGAAAATVGPGLKDGADGPLLLALERAGGDPLLGRYHLDGKEIARIHSDDPLLPDGGAEGVVVLDQYLVRFRADGGRTERVHLIIRPLTEAGVARQSEVSIPDDALVLTLRTVKPDGSTIEPEEIAGKRTVSMRGVERGDLVEYDYVRHLPPDESVPPWHLFGMFCFRSENMPTFRSRLVIDDPSGVVRVHDPAGRRPRQEEGGVSVWDAESVPAFVSEGGEPPGQEVRDCIRFGSHAGWEGLAGAFADRLVSPEFALHPATVRLARGLTAGCDSDRCRARRLFDWVREKIDGDGRDRSLAAGPARILASGSGSRLTALRGLLEAIGIGSRQWLAAPAIETFDRQAPPAGDFFDNALLEVWADGARLWLETDSRRSVFGAVNPLFRGAPGLWADRTGHGVGVIPADAGIGSGRRLQFVLVLEEDGGAAFNAIDHFDGWDGRQIGAALSRIPAGQLGRFFEMMLARAFRQPEVSRFEHGDGSDGARLYYAGRIRELASAAGGNRLELPLGFLPAGLERSFVRRPVRQHDMLLGAGEGGHARFLVRAPDGWHFSKPGDPFRLQTRFGWYESRERLLDRRTLEVVRTIELPVQRVAAADWERFADFCRTVDGHEKRTLAVVRDQGR